MTNYQQLTLVDRAKIESFRKANFSISAIAIELGKNKSTISREIKRNIGKKGYRSKQAHEKARLRITDKNKFSKWNPLLENMILQLLNQECSPTQISCRIYNEKTIKISHERIYQFIYEDKRQGGNFYLKLRQGRKKRRKKYGTGSAKTNKIPNRKSIDERPESANNRSEFGHWEGDLIIGKNHKQAMITLVDRKSGYLLMRKVKSKNAKLVAENIVELCKNFKNLVKTITFDNGLEFAAHEIIAKNLECDIYFADPYCSWQRGTNENTNGLIRQYFPKGSDFNNYSNLNVDIVMKKLNYRPRKRLDFKNPFEILYNTSVALIG